MKIKSLSGKRFYAEGEWDYEFDYEKTICTGCGSRAPNLDATTIYRKNAEDIHIFLCNACDNLFLDDLLNIEGIGHICMKDIFPEGDPLFKKYSEQCGNRCFY
jgi:hypothetical protein